MKKLEAKEHNWGLSGPGDWREIVWKVCDDASYSLRICYRPEYDGTPVPDKKIQGCLSSEDMIRACF